MKVKNMTNEKGRQVANQFIIFDKDYTVFQSYDAIIAKTTFENGKRVVYLDDYYWDYSRTTGKYRNMFLGESKSETAKKIKSGEYKLVDLNNGK
jgi:hypothetical protein